MGGYAAITLALKNPDLFVSMGSTSGALGHGRTAAEALRQGIDLTPPAQGPTLPARFAEADRLIAQLIDIPGFSTQQERTPIAAQFETPEQALAYDPFELLYQVPKSRLPHIYLDAGTEDSLVRETREFMQILLLNGVPFDFRQARGGHNAAYWRESIGHLMAIQFEVMQRALGRRP
jgi:S-formylglutathione hydrolase FrmB